MNKLIVMCGPSGSGKSTYAKTHYKNYEYVSRDVIRLSLLQENDHYFSKEKEVFAQFISTIGHSLLSKNTVADATHLNEKSRNKLFNALDRWCVEHDIIPDYSAICVFLDTPLDQCIKNNDNRSGREYVPIDEIISMYNAAVKPSTTENDHIKTVIIVGG